MSVVLYVSLFFLLGIIQENASVNLSALVEEREKLAKVVGAFGFAFIIATVTNLLKGIYFSDLQ
jgi:hypothetical protein